MAEGAEKSQHVWSAKQRIAVFLAAMRHFAQALRAASRTLHYTRLNGPDNRGTLAAELEAAIAALKTQRVVVTAPGDWRVWKSLSAVAEVAGPALEVRENRHFFTTVREFAARAQGRKSLRMEYFYREQRKRHGILMTTSPKAPAGIATPTTARPSVAPDLSTCRRAPRSSPTTSRARSSRRRCDTATRTASSA